jgi:hypothetical protein
MMDNLSMQELIWWHDSQYSIVTPWLVGMETDVFGAVDGFIVTPDFDPPETIINFPLS